MRKIVFALVVCTSGAWAQALRIDVPYTRFTLPNGLEVILHVDHTIPRVSVNTWFHVGSGNEKPGRTGFAHLFEHLMFMGSKNVPTGKYDELLESAGGYTNGSTTSDRTNYFEDMPSNALELALFMDSDRMGYLTEAMSPRSVDAQRDVVKNERRQGVENRPYGRDAIVLDEYLYPPTHPYHWSTIGSMEDLSAASYDDVIHFFRTYYTPNNASLSIAGDIDVEKTKELVRKWYSEIPRGVPAPPIEPPAAILTAEKRVAFEDRVQLPRLYMAWLTPAYYAPGDATMDVLASILANGKNSRLYKRLVYELQIAQDVTAYQWSRKLLSTFQIIVTARSGHTLTEIETVVQQELDRIKNEEPTGREVQRAVNQWQADFVDRLERSGGFGGKADQLNGYLVMTGNPDYFNEDLARYLSVDPNDVQACAQTYLRDDGRVVLSIVPQGKKELAAPGTFISVEGK